MCAEKAYRDDDGQYRHGSHDDKFLLSRLPFLFIISLRTGLRVNAAVNILLLVARCRHLLLLGYCVGRGVDRLVQWLCSIVGHAAIELVFICA